ncbi:MAG: hypothetical protein HPY61_13680 [Methanotrichaceae archaeon]|nr:hypothetical protein [Methanotrichaceae archaeon]
MMGPGQAEEVIEIPVSELQAFFVDLTQIYNNLTNVLKESGILRGRKLAEMNTRATSGIKAEKSPMGKLMLLNAYIKQKIKIIQDALKANPPASSAEEGRIRQAVTKIQLRAMAIVDHLKIIAGGKKEIAFNSSQARDFLAGKEGKPPSRRDAIRALRRAEKICPAMNCGHTPNDGRRTIRLTAKADELSDSEIRKEDVYRNSWQRSALDDTNNVQFGVRRWMLKLGH